MASWAAYRKHRDIFKSNLAICLKRQVYNSCVLPAMCRATWTLTKQAQIKLAAAQTKMETRMLNITYKDRRTNIWVRERTKVIDIMYTVRKMKWSWAGHIIRLKDNRPTSRVTTWRPYEKKRRQGRPAKRWRDGLDKYWSDTIWQRTAQDRVIWRRHAEAFTQPRDATAAWMMMMMMMIRTTPSVLTHCRNLSFVGSIICLLIYVDIHDSIYSYCQPRDPRLRWFDGFV